MTVATACLLALLPLQLEPRIAPLAPPEQARPLMAFEPQRPDAKPFTCSAYGLVDVATGRILAGRNLLQRLYPASTTKVVTTLVALEAVEAGEVSLDSLVAISETAAAVPESGIWLEAGERMTLHDLLVGVMVRSANDAAQAVAEYVGGGNAQAFIERMNRRMKELGAVDSHFINPHGLHLGMQGEEAGDQHYTCGYDLLLATMTAWRFEFFRELCVMDRKPISWENLSTEPDEQHEAQRIIANRNRLLDRYDECIGVKTGYTRQAGPSLISAAERDGRVVMAVTLKSATGEDRWVESEALLRYGLDRFAEVEVVREGETIVQVPVIDGEPETVPAMAGRGVTVLQHVGLQAPWLEPRLVSDLRAPLLSGLPVGDLQVHLAGGETRTVPLLAGGDARLSAQALWRLRYGPLVISVLGGVLMYGAATEAYRRRRRVLAPRR